MAAEAASLSPREALATIARTTAFEEPLRRRVEGVTWMVWGFVTAGATLSTNAIELVWGYDGVMELWVVPWLWLLAGVGATTAVWRIAALAKPDAHPGRRSALRSIAAVVGLIAAFWVPGSVLIPVEQQASIVLLTLAAPWLALGAVNPHRGTALGRRVMLAIGGIIAVAGLAWMPFVAGMGHGGFPQTMLFTALVGGGAALALGFWQAVRG